MPEKSKKKLRLYKFASEYNLATESLVDFLNEKGYDVKSHMSLLTDDMLSDIYNRYKKDIEKAEKHYKKISEFHKRFAVKPPTDDDDGSQEEESESAPAEQGGEDTGVSEGQDASETKQEKEDDYPEPVEARKDLDEQEHSGKQEAAEYDNIPEVEDNKQEEKKAEPKAEVKQEEVKPEPKAEEQSKPEAKTEEKKPEAVEEKPAPVEEKKTEVTHQVTKEEKQEEVKETPKAVVPEKEKPAPVEEKVNEPKAEVKPEKEEAEEVKQEKPEVKEEKPKAPVNKEVKHERVAEPKKEEKKQVTEKVEVVKEAKSAKTSEDKSEAAQDSQNEEMISGAGLMGENKQETEQSREEDNDNKDVFKTAAELEMEKKNKGLTILGKIDLNAHKKQAKKKEEEQRDNNNRRGRGDKRRDNQRRFDQGGQGDNRDNQGDQGDSNSGDRNNRNNRGKRRGQNIPQGERTVSFGPRSSDNDRPNRSQNDRDNRDNRGNRDNRDNDRRRPQQGGDNRDNRDNRRGGRDDFNRRPKSPESVYDEKVLKEDKISPADQPPIPDDDKGKKKKVLKSKKKGKADIDDTKDDAKGVKKKRKGKRFEVSKADVDEAIKRTMSSMDESAGGTLHDRANQRKKKKKEKQEQLEIEEMKKQEQSLTTLKVTEFIAVNELANLMDVSVNEVIAKCIGMGLMVSINQRLDTETITLVADEFGFEVEFQEEYKAEIIEEEEVEDEENLEPRPPVVTIMGHVDHGKTSLLDYLRHANVVSGESGGITQHIGAYKVKVDDKNSIAFLDTPGHEAFTAMRARGAKVTDIVVLIVAADDAVMPQTVEAINHAQAANVPIVIAINKIDKPNANLDKIKQQLADRNILVEDWGGKYQCAEISAKQGTNIDQLLEKILLEAEMLELKANKNRDAKATVVEAQLDKGRGVTATILVQKGTLKIGDPFIAGNFHGRVRAMFDERNKKVKQAGPSTPVLVLGFEGTPQAGDTLMVTKNEREARELANKRQQLKREQDHRQVKHLTLDEIANQISTGGIKDLAVVVKGDVDGSVEALSDSLMKLSNDEVQVKVIHKGVGAINEGDILLAAASNAIIVGFHVRPNSNARKLAETEHVDIRLYNVIYDAINEVKSALEGLLEPVISEELVATIEIRDTFKVPKIGTVAGCYVQEGRVSRNDTIRLFRDGIVIYTGELASLRRFKEDVAKVEHGYECGLNIQGFNDIKVGDIIEAYQLKETKKTLSD